MTKHTVITIMIISTYFLLASSSQSKVSIQPSTAAPKYVLKAWQIAVGDPDEYLWSIEGIPDQRSTGILYKSLASPPLRARVSRLGAGTKLNLWWGRGGRLDRNTDWDKELKDFRAFCESKGVQFDFVVDTN